MDPAQPQRESDSWYQLIDNNVRSQLDRCKVTADLVHPENDAALAAFKTWMEHSGYVRLHPENIYGDKFSEVVANAEPGFINAFMEEIVEEDEHRATGWEGFDYAESESEDEDDGGSSKLRGA